MKSDQRKRSLENERNGTSKRSHEPNYKKEKLEEQMPNIEDVTDKEEKSA